MTDEFYVIISFTGEALTNFLDNSITRAACHIQWDIAPVTCEIARDVEIMRSYINPNNQCENINRFKHLWSGARL